MEIKDAMKKCFEMQSDFWQTVFNSNPKFPYREEFNNDELFIKDTIDKEGYAEWKPREQVLSIDENTIANKLGIKLHPELKEFYSSYCFLQLTGKMSDETIIEFDRISFGCDINQHIIENHIDKEQVKEYCSDLAEFDLFELGSATVDENDGYLICFDNTRGKVLLIYFVEQLVRDLNMTLCDLLNSFTDVY